MIYTVTLNPSVDYVMFATDFKEGTLNRANKTFKFAGGKGINVSRVLSELGKPSIALGFIGGFPGELIKAQLKAQHIQNDFIEVDQDTRINVKLKGASETEINAPGPTVSASQLELLYDKISSLTIEDTVILSGSIPEGIPQEVYGHIAKLCHTNHIPFVVDAEKRLMLPTLQYGPELVKPNIHELGEMFNVVIESDKEVIHYAKALMKQGAKSVLVSMGGDGAILVGEEIFKATVPKGVVVNTVGAGDSTVAGMITGDLKLAVACGTATAYTEDLATKDMIDNVLNTINITQLEG